MSVACQWQQTTERALRVCSSTHDHIYLVSAESTEMMPPMGKICVCAAFPQQQVGAGGFKHQNMLFGCQTACHITHTIFKSADRRNGSDVTIWAELMIIGVLHCMVENRPYPVSTAMCSRGRSDRSK